MAYEPLHHKYRPQTFADLVGQEAIATTLSNAMKTQRIAPAYLLTGARGTGKTSTARIMAKSLNCLSFDAPTATPCGKCEMCLSITRGNALDITEIDAASNTGVDNIRDLIERSQFSPVQARYKVYAIDECLTGDTLIQTSDGLMRIGDPQIKGKQALSYNENLKIWELKKILRWLDQGIKSTLVIKTTHQEIRCTENHLIRTDKGWIQAKNVKGGMKILSSVNVDAAQSFINMAQTTVYGDLPEDINFTAINSDQKLTISQISLNKQRQLDLYVPVVAEKNWIFPTFYNKKVKELSVFNLIGKGIPIEKITGFGRSGHQTILTSWGLSNRKNSDLSMALYWEMAQLATLTNIVGSQDFAGHMDISSKNGWNIKPLILPKCALSSELQLIKGMELYPSAVIPLVIHNLKKFLTLLNQTAPVSKFLWNGFIEFLRKAWLGGIWTMERLLIPEIVFPYIFVPKVIPNQKINLLPNGLMGWDMQQEQNLTQNLNAQVIPTSTFLWTLPQPENGSQTCDPTQSPQWHTSLEIVKSVEIGTAERVYDLEVADNHNFLANGLLVHNCHMLSTSAFNALLKTLEEPPDRVVFILATTDPQRVLPTIISRCQRFDFRRIPLEPMVQHLTKIAKIEHININPEALLLVAQMSQGGLRDAESLLDQLSLHEGEIKNETVWDLVGSVPERDLLEVLGAIALQDSVAVIEKIRQIMDRGREPLTVLQSLGGFYRDLLIAKTAGDRQDLVALTSGTWANLKQIAQDFRVESILLGQQHLRSAEVQIRNTTQPRLWLEITLIGLFDQAPSSNVLPLTSTNQALSSSALPLTSTNQAPSSSALPLTSTNQAPSSNVSPLTSANQAPSSNVSPLTSANQALSSNDSSLTSTNQASSSNALPLTLTNQASSSSSSYQDLAIAWQQLIKYLSPPAKAIFVNKAIFLEINSDHVVIGLKDKGLREIAIKKREELEKCAKKMFNQPMQVKFRFVTSELETTPATQSLSSNNLDSNFEANTETIRPRSEVNISVEPTPAITPNIEEKTDPPPNISPQRSPREAEAIKNVITFFDGQVINLSD